MAKTQVCDTCGETKRVKCFSQIGRAPVRYATTCLPCAMEKEAQKLKEKTAERMSVRINKNAEKETKEQLRKIRKQADRDIKERKKKIRTLTRQNKNAQRQERKEKERREGVHTREMAQRTLVQRHLLPFVKRFQPNYEAGWVHKDICLRLEKFFHQVEAGESPRLMLFMPPRHGKSLLASDYFPSWVLGKRPDFEIIASSYAVSLPIGFSRRVRSRVQDKAYKNIFQTTDLDQESKSAEAWKTTVGGGYVAAGVGGGITGKGAHILIIDDPVKDAEEADSETIRDKVWDWYGSTAYTRLAPGGGVLVIQTRWHDDDLSGRLITHMRKQLEDESVRDEEIDEWEIISYPAIATEDEYLHKDGSISTDKQDGSLKLRSKNQSLHPARFPVNRLMAIKRAIQPRHWSALYQQNPVPDEGAYFTKEMFRFTPSIPARQEMAVYIAWDLAIGEKQQNDWTVGAVFGHSWDGQVYVLDIVRGKWGSHEIAQAVVGAAKRWNPDVVGIERGQIEMAVMPLIKQEMERQKVSITFDDTLRPMTDKTMRARPLQGLMQQSRVIFPGGEHFQNWVEKAQHELLRFPAGQHDDIVDAMAWCARIVVTQKEPDSPAIRKKRKSWKDGLEKIAREQRMGRRSYMGA